MRRHAIIAAALLWLAAPAAARQGEHPPGCSENLTAGARELMQKPVPLTPASGRLHQEVSTKDPEAQAYYDQGIAWLASYTWVEAARSFQEALRRDPDLAMAHLGLAKAYAGGELPEEAAHYRSKASALAALKEKVSEKEARWIALAVQQAEAVAAPPREQPAKHQAYKTALDDLIKMDPSDPFAWILRGNAEEPGPWGRGQAGGVGSIAYYEAALARDPDNLAAHHFLVHSFENIGRYEEASEHGRQYLAQCPLVPHAHHMHGHVLPRLGRWEEAKERFADADRLEREYYSSQEIASEQDWHHGHNLHLLGTVQLRLGNHAEAERLFREAFDLKAREPFGAGWYAAPYVEFLMGRGRFEEALAAARVLGSREFVMQHYLGEALAAQALLGLGRHEDAARARARAESFYKAARREARGTRYQRRFPAEHPYAVTVDGLMMLHGRRPEKGEARLLKMADDLARNPRFDAWGEGLFQLERIAAEARRAGRTKLIADLAERMHRIDPDFKSAAATGAAEAVRETSESPRGGR